MSSLTRFLKSGQLIQLLGNPAVANPPTKIKVRTGEGNVGSIVRNLEKNVNPEIPGKNNSTFSNPSTAILQPKTQKVDNSNTPIEYDGDLNKQRENESGRDYMQRRTAITQALGKNDAFLIPQNPNPLQPPHNTSTQNAS